MLKRKTVLPPEQGALRRRAIRVTAGFAAVTVVLLLGGVVILATPGNDPVDGVIAICGAAFGAFAVHLGLRLLRRGAATGDYSPPPSRGMP